MPRTYGSKTHKRHYIFYTIITAVLLCTIFLAMIATLYVSAKDDAYEDLHMQTKQIKDDINLQLISDRENLMTMANFAASLYSEEERYDIMFESFKPIGLIENIGILNADDTFVTKAGTIDVKGVLSFEEEAAKGVHISSRVSDITTKGKEIVRSAVPIKVDDKVVGILYGVIQLDTIGNKYKTMAADLNAQLFVYDKDSGDLIVDNVHDKLGNISFLKDRVYNEDYSYEQMASTDKGFTSFMSAYKNENAYLHYSTIEDIDWMIAVVRYDSQVFAQTNSLVSTLFLVFAIMIIVIVGYILLLMSKERKINNITTCASDIRMTLLEASDNQSNIVDALKQITLFTKSEAALFFDSDGEDYTYLSPSKKYDLFSENEKNLFMTELFRYASEYHNFSGNAVNILCIKPNEHLMSTNGELYSLFKKHKISDLSFSATINNVNHITILAVVNAKQSNAARMIAEKISACFSMALYNANYLNKTKRVATTDSLTGSLNRVAYKNDLISFDEEQPTDFSCIYIDVNELHRINNKYGHAAGDEMLVYIANTLKEVFYGHKVYRMGGDEFLVFCKDTDQDTVKKSIDVLAQLLMPRNYHVAIGLSFRAKNSDTEAMVKEAEQRMYEAKSQYYQNKEQEREGESLVKEYTHVNTGIAEIDTMLSIMKDKYSGIYRVSLDTDKFGKILVPDFLDKMQDEEQFSTLFSNYILETVSTDYHRALMSFLNYPVIKNQLSENKTPRITYKKVNGDTVALSVYKIGDSTQISETLWVFTKE